MIRYLLLVTLLSGCNMVLGLDEASHELADADDDGIEDSRDNCPFIANADQIDADLDRLGDVCDSCPLQRPTRDLDKDGIDDACDPCALGPSHDEDGDQIFDACDICPGVGDAAQMDTDGDAIGDVCDPVLFGQNERAAFDALAPARTTWISAEPWQRTETDDSLAPPANATGISRLTDSSLSLDGTSISVVAGIRFTAAPGAEVAVGMRSVVGDLECGVACKNASTCTLHLNIPGSTPTVRTKNIPSGVIRLRLRVEPAGIQGDQIGCDIDGAGSDGISEMYFLNLDRPPLVLLATPGIDFRWVDVFQ
jgi:hypothetical protein